MKHFALLFLSFFCTVLVCAEDQTPEWIKHVPNSNNPKFYYFVATATAPTEALALNKTLGMALQNADMNTGSPVSSQDVQNAVDQGTIETMAHTFSIPLRKVCDYRMKAGSGVRVYALYQIAAAGNIDITFPPFTECGNVGDLSIISTRPENWAIYETNRYFSSYFEMELAKDQTEAELQKELTKTVRRMLVSDIRLDTTLLNLIRSEVTYVKDNKTAYGIAYLDREVVLDAYERYVEDEIETADILMEQIRSRINEGDDANAKALLEKLNKTFKQLDSKFNFVHAYATSRKMNRLNEDRLEMNRQCKELALQVAGNRQESAEKKIVEYIQNAENAERSGKIGDALRYFYGAQVLIADLTNAGTFSYSANANQGNKVLANTYVQQHINDILSGIHISFDGFLPNSKTEGKLSFLYDRTKSDGTKETIAIANLNYIYNDNTGWSEEMPVKDGWSIVQMPVTNIPPSISVKCDYRYYEDAASDPDLQNKMQKHHFNYDKKATQIVQVVNKEILPNAPEKVAPKMSTGLSQNNVIKHIKESSHIVTANDSMMYDTLVNRVLDAIDSKLYESVYTLFTPMGYNQFEALIKYGKARIISRSCIRFVRFGGEVQCRYVPMMFTFSKGKNTLENVVFTFDKQQKIDGIQFALEENAARNIMTDTRCPSETDQLVLVNFLENYKTAFALKRLDYIRSIFADDAVIITGRILQKSDKPVDANQIAVNNVVYTRQSKQEYINRLQSSFSSKEWINIKFGYTDVEPSAQGKQFGVRLLQDYSSSNYGDRGYLFLLIDCADQDFPLIRVRTWQPETDGLKPFSLEDYSELTESIK